MTGLRNDKVYVARSTIPGLDRGVFADRPLRKGDIVERCPLVIGKDAGAPIIEDYKFMYPGKKTAVALGYGSLYNHSDDPNADWEIRPSLRQIVVRANRAIPKDTEIFIDYGPSWWKTRPDMANAETSPRREGTQSARPEAPRAASRPPAPGASTSQRGPPRAGSKRSESRR
jgi:uncharacterized protein